MMRSSFKLALLAVSLFSGANLAEAANENINGKWSSVIGLPLVPSSGAQLPDGNLLLWSADSEFNFTSAGKTNTVVFDPVNLTYTRRNYTTGHNMFCTGTTNLPDGRILINGGSNAAKTTIFNPADASLTSVQDMQVPRGYNANTILSDGSVFTFGGSWEGGLTSDKIGEIWTASGGWRKLSGVQTAGMLTSETTFAKDSHFWLIPAGNGRVFRAGPSTQMQWISTFGDGKVVAAGARSDDTVSLSGTAVMYEAGKILKTGGSELYSGGIANSRSYILDIRRGVSVTRVGSMAYNRAYQNGVVMPDGKVAIIGGQSSPVGFSDNDAVLPVEIFNPATSTFSTAAAMSVPRTYHSIALLLPDGRILSGGGGLCGGCSTNHADVQIYSPPYLFDSSGNLRSRPSITSAPTLVKYGQTASVTTDRAVTSFSMIRLNSTTHTINNDQRRLIVPFTQTGTNSYTLTMPTNAGYFLPGYWMLFALDADGTPSVARTFRVAPNGVATLEAPDAIVTSVGNSVSASPTVATIASSITYSATGLAPGLSVNPSTGAITGTATATGTYYATLRATNGDETVSTDFTIAVDPAPGNGTGLRGEYFNNRTFEGTPVLTRTEAPDLYVSSTSPGNGVSASSFAVRWTGTVQALRTGATRFQVSADDGVRLWVNGQLLVDKWQDQGATPQEGSIDLVAGQTYPVMISYYQGGGVGELRFKWQQPGDSSFSNVPASQLFTGTALSTTNLALNKTATMSGQFESAVAARGVDGNRNGSYGAGSVFHTANDVNAWWQVDLGANQSISHIRLWNRTDCCTDRLQYFVVLVSATDMGTRSYQSLTADTSIINRTFFATKIPTSIDIPINGNGRYVRVMLSSGTYLHLSEVEVYGTSANQAPTITDISAQLTNVGSNVSLTPNASDPDGDRLTYTATGLPAGLSINSSTGVITGTATTGGISSVTVTVTDPGGLNDQTTFNWSVLVNMPSVTSLPVSPALVGATVTYAPVITNASGATFSWTFGDGTAATSFSSATSTTRSFAKAGIYPVTLTLKAGDGRQSTYRFDQAVISQAQGTTKVISNAGMAYETRSGGPRLWVANPDNDSVAVIDLTTNKRTAEIPTGDHPVSVAIDKNGLVWVVNRDSATIKIIDPVKLEVTRTVTLPFGSRPTGLIFAGAAGNGIIALEAYGDLIAVSLEANTLVGDVIGSASVGPHPRALAYVEGIDRLLVPRFITPPLPGESTATIANTDSAGNVAGAEVTAVWMTGVVDRVVKLGHSTATDTEATGRGIPNYLGAPAIAPDGKSAWIPSKQDNIRRGKLRDGNDLNFQNTVRAIVSKIDLTTGLEDLGARVDLDNSGVASAAVFHPSGAYLFVALQTSRQVAVVDPVSASELFRFSVGRAPSTLSLSPNGRMLYVGNFMDRTVSVVNLAPMLDSGLKQVSIAATVDTVGTEKLSATVLKGKQLFYDAADTRLARDGYISCAACHDDGDDDGRVWDLTGFGEGLRNTVSLKGHGGTSQGFLHWSANFDEVQDFEGQIRTLSGGSGLMTDAAFNTGTRSKPLGDAKAGISTDLDALAAYVQSLSTPTPSPYRYPVGALTDEGLAGKAVFASLGCANCHGGTQMTISGNASNLKNVGTINAASGKRLDGSLTGLDVPTLLGVWNTAPYLHNGSALTLEAAIRKHNNVTVSDADMAKLLKYIQQLGPTD